VPPNLSPVPRPPRTILTTLTTPTKAAATERRLKEDAAQAVARAKKAEAEAAEAEVQRAKEQADRDRIEEEAYELRRQARAKEKSRQRREEEAREVGDVTPSREPNRTRRSFYRRSFSALFFFFFSRHFPVPATRVPVPACRHVHGCLAGQRAFNGCKCRNLLACKWRARTMAVRCARGLGRSHRNDRGSEQAFSA
jgi:hypothetical protein